MRSDWKVVSFSEAVVSLDSKRIPIRASDRVAGSYPYWGASGVVDHVNDYIFNHPSLLISEDGENLKSRKTPIAFFVEGKYWVNNHAHVFIAREGFHLQFLAYLMGQMDISGYITGSTQPKLTAGALAKIPIFVPSFPEQKRIADALDALDKLILMEREVSKKFESLAKLLGVQFMSTSISKERVPFSEMANISKGYSYKSSELIGSDSWLVSLKNVGRSGEFQARGFKPLSATPKLHQYVESGDILVAQTDLTQDHDVVGRPVRVRRGLVEGRLVASLDLVIVRPKSPYTNEYLMAVLESSDFRSHALSHCNGTTVVHMASAAVPNFSAHLPNFDLLPEFSRRVEILYKSADAAALSADRLERTRDELLPLLLSGAIRVKDVAA